MVFVLSYGLGLLNQASKSGGSTVPILLRIRSPEGA